MKTLKTWLSKNKMWVIIGAVVALLPVIAIAASKSGGVMELVGAAFCDTSQLAANPKVGMIIAPSGMFVRTGPDADKYGLVDANKKALPYCTTFEMLGRNANSTWLLVNGQGLKGWMKYDSQWEMINMNLNDLPVTDIIIQQQQPASGMPAGAAAITVTIDNNVADVAISGLPANKAFYVTLYPEGFPNKGIVFASGTANSSGQAQFKSAIPGNWPDGSAVSIGNLVMVAFVNSSQAGSLSFPYYR